MKEPVRLTPIGPFRTSVYVLNTSRHYYLKVSIKGRGGGQEPAHHGHGQTVQNYPADLYQLPAEGENGETEKIARRTKESAYS